MKKVLVITYYWPPSGGAGVQRWLKFCKYLPEFGWQPIVYTPSNPEMPVEDHSLLKDIPSAVEVIKQPIWEPYEIYKKFVGQKKGEKINTGFLTESKKPKLAEKVSVWIRGNFFIPDARVFWVKPSVKFLLEYLKENPVDAIVTTGPPHSMHLIGLELKKRLNIHWIADFRDPWTNIDFYEDLMLTSWADKKHKRLEKKVLESADCVITIGETMKKEFISLGAKNVEVITNGYDEDDVYKGEIVPDAKFSIAHIGSLVRSRNPESLWAALSQLCREIANFREVLEIKLVGKVDVSVIDSITKHGLEKNIRKIDYLPHAEISKVQKESTVLLLLLNQTKNSKGILTGKLFEYLSAARPILCIGPEDGDTAEIIRETGSGEVVGFGDEDRMREVVMKMFREKELHNPSSKGILKYSRKSLTERLREVLTA